MSAVVIVRKEEKWGVEEEFGLLFMLFMLLILLFVFVLFVLILLFILFIECK